MSNTLMGALQQAIRDTFGCANDFNGDLHVLCDYWGIPMSPISGRTIDVARKYDTSITSASPALNYLLQNGANVVPSLALNFVSTSETLDPRITFSRTTNATLVDSTGTLVYAPHNLLVQSESMDNSVWVKAATVITANSTVAPDGTTTADTISRSADGLANRNIRQNVPTTNLGEHTLSMYVKPEGATVRVALRLQDGAAVGGHCLFDLVGNGSIFSSVGAVGAIQKVGDWYRVSVAVTFTSALTSIQSLLFLGAFGNSTDPTPFSIWGAQLNVSTLQPYNPTTVKNLLGFTQEFDASSWAKSNATITANATAAPDGSVTADKLVEPAALAAPFVSQSFTSLVGTTYTYTCYGKEDPTSAKRYLMLLLVSTQFGANIRGVFDLAAGTFTVTGTATASMEFVGNGWWRCRFTATATLAASAALQVRLSNVDDGSVATYTGDGTSGIFIWGAQLSDSASLDEYRYNPAAAPASTAYYGPRFDYDPVTLAARGLLIEEQRTNSIRNNTMVGAVAGTPGTLPTNWGNNSIGLTRTIVGTGLEGGITYIDVRFNGTTTSQFGNISFETTNGVSASPAQSWTNSAYIKLVAGSFANIALAGIGLFYRDSAALFLSSLAVGSTFSSALTRYSATGTTPANTAFVQPVIFFNAVNASGDAVDFTLRIGLPQLELGAFATSVIPTSTAAATRAADVARMVGDNFANWFNAVEGTVYFEAQTAQGLNAYPWSLFGVDTLNRIFVNYNTLDRISSGVRVASIFEALVNTPNNSAPINTFGKGATAYKVNDFGFSWNGAAALTDNSLSLPVVLKFDIGNNSALAGNFLNGHIRRISYFPRRVSNAELQALTV
jgi:hypothetical protein